MNLPEVILENPIHTFCQFYNSETYSDVVIVIKNGSKELRIPAHRVILSENSQFFERLFYNNSMQNGVTFDSNNRLIYTLNVPDEESLLIYRLMIEFMYGCRIKFSFEQFSQIYTAADYLVISKFGDQFLKYFKTNFNESQQFALSIFLLNQLLHIFPYDSLTKQLLDLICENFKTLENFLIQNASLDLLVSLSKQDNLNINEEYELIVFLEKWRIVNQTQQNYDHEFNTRIIPNIRMATINKIEYPGLVQSPLSNLSNYQLLLQETQNYVQDVRNRLPNNRDLPRFEVTRHRFYEFPWQLTYETSLSPTTPSSAIGFEIPIFNAIILNLSQNICTNQWSFVLSEFIFNNDLKWLNIGVLALINLNSVACSKIDKIGNGTMIRVTKSSRQLINGKKGYVIDDFEVVFGRTPQIIQSYPLTVYDVVY